MALDLDVFVWRVGHVASRGPATLMRRSGPPGPAARTVYLAKRGRRRPRRPLTPPRPVPIVGPHGSGAWRRRSIRTRGNSMTARTRPAGPLVKASMVLILLLVLAAAVGVARAAASSSPAARREAHAAHRHGAGAGQPEPVHRHPGHRLHALAHELRLPRRVRLQDAGAAARARHRVGGLRGRQGVDLHHPRGLHLARRQARHGARRRLHLQLHRRQRAPEPLHVHQRHHRRRGDRRHARQGHDRARPRRTCSGWSSRSCRSTSGARSAARRPPPATRTSRRSSATAPSRSWSGSRASSCASRPTPPTGPASPRWTRSSSELYTNPDTMAQDLKLGTIDGAVDIPPAQFEPLGGEDGITTSKSTRGTSSSWP